MNKSWWLGCLFLGLFAASAWILHLGQALALNPDEAIQMGMQIWQNECGRKRQGLTSWNQGEDFASLGIGHFIWYPEGQQSTFKEMFPDLLKFFSLHGVVLPDWLKEAKGKGCPWETREAFLQDQLDPRMEELRELLITHIDLQVWFMVERLHRALPTILRFTSLDQKERITNQFYRLAQTPTGLFVLLDYLNFKGEGISFQEHYQGHGWGLLQVLEIMEGQGRGKDAVREFVESAKKVLIRRIENAPKERGEQRWLKGWMNRVDSYSTISFKYFVVKVVVTRDTR